jgi:6-phosphogluconolactonase
MSEREIIRCANAIEVASFAARAFIERVVELQFGGRAVHVSLTGGTVGILTLKSLASEPDLDRIDKNRLHIWWGDERFVEAESDQRNAKQARDALLNHWDISAANVHEFAASDQGLTIGEAADAFMAHVVEVFGQAKPKIDIALLGMGPDGHVNSLFPGAARPLADQVVYAETSSPKPPAERLSFNYEATNEASEIWFVVSGSDKAEAAEKVLSDETSDLPAAQIAGKKLTKWFIDQAAGAAFWSC